MRIALRQWHLYGCQGRLQPCHSDCFYGMLDERPGEGVIFRRKVYWGAAVGATGGSCVMLYIQYAGVVWDVFTVHKTTINPKPTEIEGEYVTKK
jgi:hypothetical protein